MPHREYSDLQEDFWRFYCDTKIFAVLKIAEARALIRRLQDYWQLHHLIIVTDSGVARSAFFHELIRGLGADVLQVGEDCDSEPMADAVERLGVECPDGLLSIGGGSVMDAAKLIAASAGTGVPLETLRQCQVLPGKPLPHLAIPTTFGTGSEANLYGHLKMPSGRYGLRKSWLAPTAAILIGELAETMPEQIRLLGAIDAWVHCLEARTQLRERSPLQEALLDRAMQMHRDSFEDFVRFPSAEIGLEMATVACIAGIGLNNGRTGLAHTLAVPFAYRFQLPHALSLLPFVEPVFKFNASGYQTLLGGDRAENLYQFWIKTAQPLILPFLEKQEIRVTDNDLDVMTREATLDTVMFKENPFPIEAVDLRQLYETALEPWLA